MIAVKNNKVAREMWLIVYRVILDKGLRSEVGSFSRGNMNSYIEIYESKIANAPKNQDSIEFTEDENNIISLTYICFYQKVRKFMKFFKRFAFNRFFEKSHLVMMENYNIESLRKAMYCE